MGSCKEIVSLKIKHIKVKRLKTINIYIIKINKTLKLEKSCERFLNKCHFEMEAKSYPNLAYKESL